MIFIEVISHASFFVLFLTAFYVTYVGFIMQRSMVEEFTLLLKETLQVLIVVLPPQLLQIIQNILYGTRPMVEDALNTLVVQEQGENKQLLTPVFIGVFVSASIGLSLAIILTIYYGGSVVELLYTNLISLSFIAVTDFIITALYGQFRLIDTQFLSGMFAVKAAGGTLNCDIVENTLDSMFPIPFVQNIINAFLKSEGQVPQ